MDTQLYIDIPRTTCLPGERLEGKVLWALEKAPGEIRISLGWWTEGRGSKDAKVEDEITWKTDAVAGEESFAFTLPASPYSFNGPLISLKWGLELSAWETDDKLLLDISIGPDGNALALESVNHESNRKSFSLFGNR